MKFYRILSNEEVRKLSKEEDREYHAWLQAKQIEQRKEERKNWVFQNWVDEAFTLNNYIAARRDHFLKEERIEELVQNRLQSNKEKFTFFWETESPFSQWHPATFIGPVYMWDNEFLKQLLKEGFPENRTFVSAEQWMMYCKAMLFMDFEVAEEIMKNIDPRIIKNWGRKVKRFNDDTWRVYRWRFVYQGNEYKFKQNETLKKALLNTQGTTLVEASPDDTIWGIGLLESDPNARKRETWKGLNLLGEILTELRINIAGHY